MCMMQSKGVFKLKKILTLIGAVLLFAMGVLFTSACGSDNVELRLQINNDIMTVNNENVTLDSAPQIINGRTLVPVRAVIENMGGSAQWDSSTQTSTLNYNNNVIKLTVGSTNAYFNGEEHILDTAPAIINGRTMLPIRFITESFGFDTLWENDSQTVVIKKSIETAVEKTSEPVTEVTSVDNSADKANGKTLVAYFTWSGNTKKMAEYIAEKTDADIFIIEPETPYPDDYTECGNLAKVERDENARPAIKSLPNNLSEYDTIYVGYPIWWHTAPMIIGSFLESDDFAGVDIYPFTQSASMDKEQFNNSMEFVKKCAPKANVHNGLFTDSSDEDGILTYLKDNGIVK